MTTNRVQIFDTTLRDGEQSPGASLNIDEKVEIARQLERLGVDIIEAGFPISSPGDFEAVRRIAALIGDGVTVCGLTRARPKDIDVAWDALKGAKRPRIHTGLGVSESHLQHKLKISRDQALDVASPPSSTPGRSAAPTSSTSPRTAGGPTRSICTASSRPSSKPARPSSMSPTPRATPPRRNTARCSRASWNTSPARRSRCRPTVTMTWAWRRPTRSPPPAPGRGRSNAPSTASGSARATRRWKRSSWRCTRAGTPTA